MASVSPSDSASRGVESARSYTPVVVESPGSMVEVLTALAALQPGLVDAKDVLKRWSGAYHAYLRKLPSEHTSSGSVTEVSVPVSSGQSSSVGRVVRRKSSSSAATSTSWRSTRSDKVARPYDVSPERRITPSRPGYCYLTAIRSGARVTAAKELGFSPTVFSLLTAPALWFQDNSGLQSLRVVIVGGSCHLRAAGPGLRFFDVLVKVAVERMEFDQSMLGSRLIEAVSEMDKGAEFCGVDGLLTVGSVSGSQSKVVDRLEVREPFEQGYCYLGLILPQYRSAAVEKYGCWPALSDILDISGLWLDLERAQVARLREVSDGKYHIEFGMSEGSESYIRYVANKRYVDDAIVVGGSDDLSYLERSVSKYDESQSDDGIEGDEECIEVDAVEHQELRDGDTGRVPRDDKPGYCYLRLIKPHRRSHCVERCGLWPKVSDLLAMPQEDFDLDACTTLAVIVQGSSLHVSSVPGQRSIVHYLKDSGDLGKVDLTALQIGGVVMQFPIRRRYSICDFPSVDVVADGFSYDSVWSVDKRTMFDVRLVVRPQAEIVTSQLCKCLGTPKLRFELVGVCVPETSTVEDQVVGPNAVRLNSWIQDEVRAGLDVDVSQLVDGLDFTFRNVSVAELYGVGNLSSQNCHLAMRVTAKGYDCEFAVLTQSSFPFFVKGYGTS